MGFQKETAGEGRKGGVLDFENILNIAPPSHAGKIFLRPLGRRFFHPCLDSGSYNLAIISLNHQSEDMYIHCYFAFLCCLLYVFEQKIERI